MIQLVRLEIDNFLCFGEGVCIDFQHQGLVCITGENLDSSASNSNGAGKSAILEAIYYCIYGKILRPGKVRLDQTVRRGCDSGSKVVLSYIDEKDRFLQIRRFCGHSEYGNALYFKNMENGEEYDLEGQDKDATQQLINTSIKVSSSLFRQIVLFGEGGMPRFSALSDSDKKKLIEEILGLSTYEQAAKLSRERLGSYLEKRNRVTRELEGLQNHQTTAQKRLADLKRARAERENTFLREMEYLSKEISKLEEVKEALAEIDPVLWTEEKENKQYELEQVREALQMVVKKERRVNQGYMQKRDELTQELSALNGQRLFLQQSHDQLDSLLFDGICPTCKQSTENLDASVLDDLKREMVNVRKEEVRIRGVMENLEQAKEKVITGLRQEEGELYMKESSLTEDVKKLTAQIVSFSEKASSLELLSKLRMRKEELEFHHQEDLSSELEKEAANEVKVLCGKISSHQKLLDEADQMAAKYKVLNDVFLLIRSFVFESFSKDLNLGLQRYCKIQNEGNLSASISTTSETAKGEHREKISLVVHNPTGGESYSSCSVGEKRRLDLPIAFALQDFAACRGLSLGISLLDEMFEAVDEVGKQGIFRLLSAVSQRNHTPSVFVVTHSDSLKPMFSSFLNVRKENGVSSIQKYNI